MRNAEPRASLAHAFHQLPKKVSREVVLNHGNSAVRSEGAQLPSPVRENLQSIPTECLTSRLEVSGSSTTIDSRVAQGLCYDADGRPVLESCLPRGSQRVETVDEITQ